MSKRYPTVLMEQESYWQKQHELERIARNAAESQVAALQEQVKALQDALDTAKIVLVDSDHGSSRGGFTFSERRYRALLKLDAALSQVPAQKEQDNG